MLLRSLLLLLLTASVAHAQHGTVTYQERVTLNIDIPEQYRHLLGDIPTEQISEQQLLFDGPISVQRQVPKEAEQLEAQDRRNMIIFRPGSTEAEDVIFVDRETGRYAERRDFLGRTFLIEDSLTALPWRLTGERATFQGYLTMQAVASTSDTTQVEAWFTPQIAAPVGPGRFGGLPGLILMLTDGPRSFVAQAIETDAPDAALLRPPTDGRRVTQAEFEATIEQRTREMGGRTIR